MDAGANVSIFNTQSFTNLPLNDLSSLGSEFAQSLKARAEPEIQKVGSIAKKVTALQQLMKTIDPLRLVEVSNTDLMNLPLQASFYDSSSVSCSAKELPVIELQVVDSQKVKELKLANAAYGKYSVQVELDFSKFYGIARAEYNSGKILEGEWRRGHLQGYGSRTHKGAVYKGEFQEGKRHGLGEENNEAQKTLYSGQWDNGKRHGFGQEKRPDGTIVTGRWCQGEIQETFWIHYPDGGHYTGGTLKDGKRDGVGIYTLNGQSYRGMWKEDQLVRLIYPPHKYYKGDFRGLTPDGYGTLVDGSFKFKGIWCNGELLQLDTIIYPNKDRYLGDWENHQPHGWGTMNYSDGTSYTGQWHNGLRQGSGKMTLPDGDYYEGEWYKNLYHGRGKLVSSGKEIVGVWKKGELII